MVEKCETIKEALRSITTTAELEGFIDAIRNPELKTKEPTEDEWNEIAHKRIRLGGGR